MRFFQKRLLIIVMALVFVQAGDAWACPNCKEAVTAQPGEVANMAQGYNWSIMLMLCMPITLLSTGALMVRRAVKLGRFPEI